VSVKRAGVAMVFVAWTLAAGTPPVGSSRGSGPPPAGPGREPGAVPAGSGLKHGVVWYTKAPDEGICRLAASRYTVGVTGKGDLSDADKVTIKSHNPDFRWFVYNSGTDNYVESAQGTEEHALLCTLAMRRGWDPDAAYLHYWDDTRLVLEGDTLWVRGWGGGGAKQASEARVPVYYKNLSRRVTNFSTRRAAQLHKEVIVRLAFDTPFQGSQFYADGIFLDNSAAQLYNFGTIVSGGHVAETPGRLRIGSREFQSWQWNSNLGPFLTALKDTLEGSAAWVADHRRKSLMINVANIWDDGYVSRDAADVLFLEFQYNPVRSCGPNMVDEAYRRDVLAAKAGIASFYSAGMSNSVQGRPGEVGYAQVLLGNLAWYLTTRTESTLFYEMGTNAPSTAGWDTLVWRGCIDVAGKQLGSALGGPYTLAHGEDPLGNPYVVKARRYEHGLVLLRNRGDWNQGIEPATAVTVRLARPMAPIDPAGRVGSSTEEISLRNGDAAILLGDPPDPP
jgi:hypothetical protein